MAVMTYTRRQVVDMLPEFLTKRIGGFGAEREAFLSANGVTPEVMQTLAAGLLLADEQGRVLRSRYAWRSPYAVKPPAALAGWPHVVSAGLAEATEDGWRVSPRGLELARELRRRVREHLRGLDLPGEPVKRAADALSPIADRIPADAQHSGLPRRLRPSADELRADVIRLNHAVEELWYFRDDCHIGAWQDAGYEGPAFDVLSFIWSGRPDMSFTRPKGGTTVDELAETLKARQDREDVERSLAALATRGDLIREGGSVALTPEGRSRREAIEDETDRRYFAIWDLDDAATSRLGEDLRAVIDALPRA